MLLCDTLTSCLLNQIYDNARTAGAALTVAKASSVAAEAFQRVCVELEERLEKTADEQAALSEQLEQLEVAGVPAGGGGTGPSGDAFFFPSLLVPNTPVLLHSYHSFVPS